MPLVRPLQAIWFYPDGLSYTLPPGLVPAVRGLLPEPSPGVDKAPRFHVYGKSKEPAEVRIPDNLKLLEDYAYNLDGVAKMLQNAVSTKPECTYEA